MLGFRYASALGLIVALAAGMAPAAAETGTEAARAEAARLLAEEVMAADDPEAAYELLDAEQRALLDDFGIATEEEVGSLEIVPVPSIIQPDGSLIEADLSVRCWRATWYTEGRNWWGAKLYRYYLSANWCAKDGKVYGGNMLDRWAETYWPGWRFHGHVKWGHTIQYNNEYRVYTQGHFTYGSGGWTLQEQWPCIQIRGRGNGSRVGLASCNLT